MTATPSTSAATTVAAARTVSSADLFLQQISAHAALLQVRPDETKSISASDNWRITARASPLRVSSFARSRRVDVQILKPGAWVEWPDGSRGAGVP
jgi:hypothetical protein